MTAQEAIERLHNLQSIKEDDLSAYIGVWYKGIKDDYDEALKMAIEALQRGLENVNADSCSEKPNRSEPKTAESGSVDSEMPEIKTDRTTSGDLIRRQDAIYYVKQATIGETDVMKAWVKAQTHLMRLPSAQPERKKGEWIDQDDGAYYPVECSECRKIPLFDVYGDYILSNFCPNCGAKMKGDTNG